MKRKIKFNGFINLQRAEDGTVLPGTNRYSTDYPFIGTFHQWGSAIEDDGKSFSPYTIAIIEVPGGGIEEVTPARVKFLYEEKFERWLEAVRQEKIKNSDIYECDELDPEEFLEYFNSDDPDVLDAADQSFMEDWKRGKSGAADADDHELYAD